MQEQNITANREETSSLSKPPLPQPDLIFRIQDYVGSSNFPLKIEMQTVNFKKYADIIVNLQMKNDSYYLIKRFDDDTLDHIRNRFDKERGLNFMDRFNRLSDEIIELQKAGVSPESEKCQRVVKEY